MGDCRYCGKSAGFLRKQHQECAERHNHAMETVRSACVDAALRGVGLEDLKGRIEEEAASADVEMYEYELTEVLENGWTRPWRRRWKTMCCPMKRSAV